MIAFVKSYFQARYAPVREGAYNDYLITIVVNILAQVCIVVSGILTARLLGPAGKGDLTTVLFIPSLMLSVGILSLPQSVALHISRRTMSTKSVAANGFWMSLGLGLIEAAILYPLIPILLGSKGEPVVRLARMGLVYLPIAFTGFTLLGVDQGLQRFKKYNLLKHLPTFLYALLLIGLAILKAANVPALFVGFILSQAVATAVLIASSENRLARPIRTEPLATAGPIFRQGLVYAMPALSGILLMRADLAILIPIVSANEVGLYSAALAIAMGQNVLTSSIVQVNFPKVCSANGAACVKIIRNQLNKAVVPILLVAAIVAAGSPFIIRYLLGPSFTEAQDTTLVLIAAIMVYCIGQIIDNGLRGAGLGLPSSVSYVIGIAVLIAASAYLVPKYGSIGMSVAFLLAQLGATAALLTALRRLIRKMRP